MLNTGEVYRERVESTVEIQRFDLESKLQLLAIINCIWGGVLLIYPSIFPIWLCAYTFILIGGLLALWCSAKGPHAVSRLITLSVCFGLGGVATLIATKSLVTFTLYALFTISYAWEAFSKLRKTRRESRSAPILPAEAVLPATNELPVPYQLPMMPVRDMAIVPGTRTPLVVGRKSSVLALEYAQTNNSNMFLATQHDEAAVDPRPAEISKFGCICKVLQSIKMADGNFKVLVEGLEMGKAVATDESMSFFIATVQGLNIKSETVSTAPAA